MSIQTATSPKPGFREATNLLRGVCAFAVIVWHYQHFFYVGTDALDIDLSVQPFYESLKIFYRFGYRAVPIFWCISGLIITHTYINHWKVSARNFFVSRVSRLYPAHLLTLMVVAALQIISNYKYGEFQIYGSNDLFHFVLNIFFIQSWGFASGNSFNAQTWSVSVEIAVYIFFFIILKKIQKFKLSGALAVLIFCILFDWRFDKIASRLFFLDCLTYFATGMFIYFVVEKLNISDRNDRRIISNTSILLFLLLARFFDVLTFHNNSGAWVFISSYLVFILAQFDGSRIARQLNKLKIFGDLSYSVFLWHIPIQIIIKIFLRNSESNSSYATNKIFFVSYLIITYIVGYLSFRLVERPSQRFLRQKLMATNRIG